MIALIMMIVIVVLKTFCVAGVSLKTSAALDLTVTMVISVDTGYRKTTIVLTLKLQWRVYQWTLLQYIVIYNACFLLFLYRYHSLAMGQFQYHQIMSSIFVY